MNNLSKFTISLANEKKINASGVGTILQSAKNEGLILDYSCSNGQCGSCSCQLISGEVEIIDDLYHTPEEIQNGKILTCQSKPLSDIEIDIEDLGIYAGYPTKIYPARVSEISFIAKDVIKLVLRTHPGNKLEFISGQYVDLIHDDVRRSYSIANGPRENGTIDLIIKKIPDGKISNVLFGETKTNDLFRLEAPLGTFGWRASLNQNIVFLATGTGIAPVISMLENTQLDKKNIFIIWGNRYEDEFFDLPLCAANFELIKVLSRKPCKGFEFGHVQDILLSMKTNLANTTVFACGSDSMIKSSKKILFEKGLRKKSFFSDSFVSSGNQL